MKLELTAGGLDFLSHCLEGGPSPIFCKISYGNGVDAGTSAEEMSNPVKDIEISEITRAAGSSFVTLIGVLNNAEVEERFKANEIGVYITDPDNDTGSGVILFAYGYVPDEEAAVIPAAADYAFETVEKVMVYVGATENVSALISESLTAATKAEVQAHVDNETNPHKVTAEQVGLGNVENKSINEQTPELDHLYSDYSYYEDGMPLKEILNRLISAAYALEYHERDEDNPHRLLPGTIGAAKAEHNHSASDIKDGILSIARGGTGTNSIKGLASLLSSYFAVPHFGVYTGNGGTKRLVSLGFTPSAVLILDSRGLTGDDVNGTCGGLALNGSGVRGYYSSSVADASTWNNNHSAIMITTNGFYVNFNSANKVNTNKNGETYRYIAFR